MENKEFDFQRESLMEGFQYETYNHVIFISRSPDRKL